MPIKNCNGIDINYIDVGVGNVVVLLHGLGSSNKDWDLQIPVLSQYFRVIAPDFRAHGQSTRVPKFQGVNYMKEDVFSLLESLEIQKASFVGFSMGGAVAFQMAIDYQDLVDKLVIINSGPDFNNVNDSGVDILAERTKIIKEKGFKTLASKISEGMFPLESQKQWRKEFEERIMNNDEDAYLQTFGELMKWGIGDQVSKIEHPTLVVASDQDYTSLEYKKIYANKMNNSKLVVIKNSRHGVVLDGAQQLNDHILKFLLNE